MLQLIEGLVKATLCNTKWRQYAYLRQILGTVTSERNILTASGLMVAWQERNPQHGINGMREEEPRGNDAHKPFRIWIMETMEWEEKMSREVMTHINHFVSESTLQLLNPDMKSKVEEFYSDVWTPEWWCTQHRRRLAQRGQIDDTSEWLTSLASEYWI